MKVETLEAITPAIKAHSDYVARVAAFSRANPSVALKDNPYLDDALDAQLIKAAFGGRIENYRCPCGYTTPKIDATLNVVHDDDARTPTCASTTVIVTRKVRNAR